MKRRRLTRKQKRELIFNNGGRCHICGEIINLPREGLDSIEIEHVVPLALGGDRIAPAHRDCHARKTKQDRKDIAKAKRVAAKHDGSYRSSRNIIPGSKRSRFKKKVGGGVEDRITGETLK